MVILLYVPYLLAPGMHPDGVTYATISRNLAEGRGTFWEPFFTETFFPAFYEHPPLVFGIESLFFRVLGDHLFVEKLYTFICFLVTGWLLFKMWAILTGDKANAWVLFIFWAAIPEVPFDYANNFLENTMGIFCFAACFILLENFLQEKYKKLPIVISGLLIFLGCLSKGPFALFPLALPGLYWLSCTKITFKTALLSTLYLTIILVVCFSILMLWPAAKNNLLTYLSSQVVASIEGKRSLPGNRLFLLNTLIYKLKPIYFSIPVILLAGAAVIRKKEVKPQYRIALFFFLMALSVNLPVMISPRQLEQYILCAYAFYALAAAALITPYFNFWINQFIKPNPAVFKSILFITAMAIIAAGYYAYNYREEYAMDKETLIEVQRLQPYVVKNSVLPVCNNFYRGWPLRALIYREYHISTSGEDSTKAYFLSSEDCKFGAPPGYIQLFKDDKYALWWKGKSR